MKFIHEQQKFHPHLQYIQISKEFHLFIYFQKVLFKGPQNF
jgi:hypothetical protein